GAGNLGRAIANHTYYYKTGFIVEGIFETNPDAIGTKINEVEVMDYENLVEFVEDNDIDIGIICTTKEVAQEVADKLCFAGVKGLWNFAPIDIETPSHVAVENVHMSDGLHSLAYHISKNAE
ncbi:MAG: redox-sensing transcriptional repressor Rex, partial [Bacillota bacterium]|nr:redox-sensing transcriptional repressor Rex [Bacillota bacterium]